MGKRTLPPDPARPLLFIFFLLFYVVFTLPLALLFGFSARLLLLMVPGSVFALPAIYWVFATGERLRLARVRARLEPLAKKKKINGVIIGAGFGGIGMAHQLREIGVTELTIVDKNADWGGTWYENTYPNASCDVFGHWYTFSYLPHDWPRTYASGREIVEYLLRCVAEFGLSKLARFNTRVERVHWNRTRKMWSVYTHNTRTDERAVLEANFVVSAVGQLNLPFTPAFDGLDSFKGTVLHSARWSEAAAEAIKGKRVVSIGSGPSAVQVIPYLSEHAKKLTAFMRSVTHCIDRLERVYPMWLRAVWKYLPWTRQLYAWYSGNFFSEALWRTGVSGSSARADFEEACRVKREQECSNTPGLADKLKPQGPLMCKRILISDHFFPALDQPHVDVIPGPDGVARFTETGVVTKNGATIDADTVVMLTGFRSNEFLASLQVTCGDGDEPQGKTLSERWGKSGETTNAYWGIIADPDFPNLFMLYGPHTNRGTVSIIMMLECQANYIKQLVERMVRVSPSSTPMCAVKPEAHTRFAKEYDEAMSKLVFSDKECTSWYRVGRDGRVINNCHLSCFSWWWSTLWPKWNDLEIK